VFRALIRISIVGRIRECHSQLHCATLQLFGSDSIGQSRFRLSLDHSSSWRELTRAPNRIFAITTKPACFYLLLYYLSMEFLATAASDKDTLRRIAMSASDDWIRAVLLAHEIFRHQLIEHHWDTVRNTVFSPDVIGHASVAWADRVMHAVDHLDLLDFRLDQSTRRIVFHYLQRWARQVMDPLSPVEVYRSPQYGIGLRLRAGVSVRVRRNEAFLDTYLDGLVVFVTEWDVEDVDRLFSLYRTRNDARMGVLVGPLSLVNHSAHSPLAFRDCPPSKVELLASTERRKPLCDRLWSDDHAVALSRYVWISYEQVIMPDGHLRPAEISYTPGSPIEVHYGN